MQWNTRRFAPILPVRFRRTTACLIALLGAMGLAAWRANTSAASTGRCPRWSIQARRAGRPPTPSCSSTAKTFRNGQNGEDWLVQDGAAVAQKHDIHTKQAFGDCQLHVEWAEPEKIEGAGQGRGNSGVFLMGIYEVQVLDSYQNDTYPDGQCGSIYKQRPPLVNVNRKPGEWQTYDIIWQGPRFDAAGKLTRPAYITVLQNGVLVQNHFKLRGQTFWDQKPHYSPHPPKLPLSLQFHANPVRFRNIWIREL